MAALEPPQSHYLSAAEGWLELGDIPEARAELARIPAEFQEHPEVLKIRWAVIAGEKDWPAAFEISGLLVQKEPKSPCGWLHHAFAMRRMPKGGLQAAWDFLFPVLEIFPKVAIIPYNLACYACQLQQVDKARELFQRALNAGNKEQIKQLALDDSDLQPLWPEIRQL
jgi:tetratricopeptide (TPR) repeat protein